MLKKFINNLDNNFGLLDDTFYDKINQKLIIITSDNFNLINDIKFITTIFKNFDSHEGNKVSVINFADLDTLISTYKEAYKKEADTLSS